jgi:hypothetical protein
MRGSTKYDEQAEQLLQDQDDEVKNNKLLQALA